MDIKSLKLLCFSPTGTTEQVVRAVARGIDINDVELIDVTKPEARSHSLKFSEDELIVVGVPVYMGRVPGLLQEWFKKIQADRSPAVGVVVYGNRVYDDAMLELKDLLQRQGAVPIACAAYIGEHSFSSAEIPTAQGRPDNNDLGHAEMFGSKIREKLDSTTDLAQSCVKDLPGEFPYRGSTDLWNMDFIAVDESCVQCGLCAEICPTGAIDAEDSSVIDIVRCITCCACLKKCLNQARTMKDGQVKDARVRLNNLFSEPKEPEFYL